MKRTRGTAYTIDHLCRQRDASHPEFEFEFEFSEIGSVVEATGARPPFEQLTHPSPKNAAPKERADDVCLVAP